MNGHKIESITAIVVTDPIEGEGIPSIMGPDGVEMPLVGSDHIRVEQLYKAAMFICGNAGKEFRVLKFSVREDITDQVRQLYGKKQN